MRNSYCVNDTRVETGPLAEACPADEKGWTEWWEVGWLSTYLSSKADAQGGETPMEFYQKFIDSEHKKRDSVNILFSQGARFAVSRETILRRTKEEYARILTRATTWSGCGASSSTATSRLATCRHPLRPASPQHRTRMRWTV